MSPVFGHRERGHLGDAAAALVDGMLSHSARDLALAHIAHCEVCRDEVEAQRAMKARLLGLGGSRLNVPTEVLASVIALAAQPPAVQSAQPITFTTPAYLPHRRVRLAAAAGVSVAAGVGLLIAIGGTEEPGAPIQPAVANMVDQHATTTGEVPVIDPGFSAVTAGFVGSAAR